MTEKTTAQQALFRQIYARYYRPMRAYAERLMRTAPHLAEDVLQEAFWAVSRNMDTVSRLSEIQQEVYIEKAVKHAAWSMLAKEQVPLQRTEVYEEEGAYDRSGDLPLETLCRREDREEVLKTIRSLPERYQRLLELYYLDGYALHEIAGLLQISYDAARKRHERGRALLIRRLTAAQQTANTAEPVWTPCPEGSIAPGRKQRRVRKSPSGQRTFCQLWTACAMCALLLFGTATSPLLRASMVHIVKEVFPGRTHLQFSVPEDTNISRWFTLAALPEGYVQTHIVRDDNAPSLSQRWTCTNGGYRYISLVQCGLGGDSILNTEGCTEQSVTVNGCPGFLYTQGNARQKLIWSTNESVFIITIIGSDTGKLDLIGLAESLVVLE